MFYEAKPCFIFEKIHSAIREFKEIKGQIFSPRGVKFQSLIKDAQLTWPVQSKVEPSDPLD